MGKQICPSCGKPSILVKVNRPVGWPDRVVVGSRCWELVEVFDCCHKRYDVKPWWQIKEHPNWNREMAAYYEAGLEDAQKGHVRKDGLTFQDCYDQGYDHGEEQRQSKV